MNKKLVALILAFSVLFSMWTLNFQVFALGDSETERTAELTPSYSEDYLQYLDDQKNGVPSRFGDVVPPTNIERVDASSILSAARSNVSYPAVFDPRPLGLMSPVKNQSDLGDGARAICAVFAAHANLETFNIKKFGSTPIYSEEYFDYFTASDAFGPNTYNPYTFGKRNLHTEAVGDTALWFSSVIGYGPVLESQFPYGSQGYLADDTLIKTPQSLTVYDYYTDPWLNMNSYTPEVTKQRVNDIKKLISEDGSCIIYNFIRSPYSDANIKNVYVPVQEAIDNKVSYTHAVTLVGWDDNYSKNNFTKTPANNGAFIVKNSWGTGSGYSGYFYLSYEDYFICANGPRGVTDVSSVKRYDDMYSYTQFGDNHTFAYVSSSPAFWTANIFDIKGGQQQLESIGIELIHSKTEYEVFICQNVNSGAAAGKVLNPADMQKIYSGYHEKMGYHTIMLDKPVKLNSPNGKFAIIIKYTDDGDGQNGIWNPSMEEKKTDENRFTYLPANTGESYYSSVEEGSTWFDCSSSYSVNFIINAYTNEIDENSNNPLCVQFSAPADWGDSANITFYKAGELSGRTVPMEKLSAGKFIYRNNNLRQCTFTVDDGAGGHKTTYLYACGSVKVENNTVSYAPMPMQVDFKKPEDWTGKAKIYYYSNDSTETAHKAWPGDNMISTGDGWYRYYITDMQDVRVLFNDGNKQYPNLLKDGMVLKCGQDLIWQDGAYHYDDRAPLSVHFYPPAILQNYNSFYIEIKDGSSVTEGFLQDSGKGYFEYIADSLTRGNLTIYADGGRVIYDALIAGGVTVNGTKLYSRPKEPIQVRFQPPAGWSDNVSIYYYTDDQRYIEHSAWPGTPMTPEAGNWYTYTITDMDNTRILFTDGSHQLPALLQEGQPACSGQSLIYQNKTCIYDDGQTPVDILFYKPDDWDDTVLISVKDYGSSATYSSMMTDEGGNLYSKKYAARTKAEITLSDMSGHKTQTLAVAGRVTISQNTAVQRPKTPMPVTFEKPASWGSNVSMYVFTNDDSYTSFTKWPGNALTKGTDGIYRGEITDTNNAKVFFTDGTNQYPSKTSTSNGIPLKEGQALYANGTTYKISKS